MKVLIVDDSRSMRATIRDVLTSMKITDIDEAVEGADALSKATLSKPDLILLDWNMPTMNGLEFLKAYRAQRGSAAVIMITVVAEKDRVLDAINAGANGYVIKPFEAETLKLQIESTLQRAAV